MANELSKHSQKIKLLVLYDLLKEETDEMNPMTTDEICLRLEEMGIVCDRRTLSKDIDLLNETNHEVLSKRIGHAKAYYVPELKFSMEKSIALLYFELTIKNAYEFSSPSSSQKNISTWTGQGGVLPFSMVTESDMLISAVKVARTEMDYE